MAKNRKTQEPKEPETAYIVQDDEIREIEKLAEIYPVIKKLYTLYMDYLHDPSKGWRSMVVFAQKELNRELKNKTLNIVDDGYHKSLFELLKSGSTVSKTIKSSIEDSISEDDPIKKQDDLPINVPIITAETASKTY